MSGQMSERQRTSWAFNALLLVAVGVVGFVMYGLVEENRELKARIAQLQATPVAGSLVAGAELPEARVMAPGSEAADLREVVGEGGVVAFLTTTCPYCRATLPTWSRLAEQASASGHVFVAVSLDSPEATRAYVEETGIEFPVLVPATTADAAAIDVVTVPYTVVVGPDQTIRDGWLGQLSDTSAASIATALDDLENGRLLSGSPDEDPDWGEAPAPGTGAGR